MSPRRAVGVLLLLCGLSSAALMAVAAAKPASLYIDAAAWTRLLFGHFLITAGGPVVYLAILGFGRRFEPGPFVDHLAGFLGYTSLLALCGIVLRSAPVTPWLSVLPGAALAAYGARLCAGRQWKALEPRA